MKVNRVSMVLAIGLWGTAALAATVGSESLRLAAISPPCIVQVRLGQAPGPQGSSSALAGSLHADLDEYLEMHAQARETIHRSALAPGTELRVQANHGENLTK